MTPKIQKQVSKQLCITLSEELRMFAKDASNGLSHEKMLQVVNLRHPRKVVHVNPVVTEY